jgi:hypothetical protein
MLGAMVRVAHQQVVGVRFFFDLSKRFEKMMGEKRGKIPPPPPVTTTTQIAQFDVQPSSNFSYQPCSAAFLK